MKKLLVIKNRPIGVFLIQLTNVMDQRIRVLRVIARLNIGGPAIHATVLTERLDPTRYASRLLAGREAPHEGNYLDLHGRTLAQLTVVPELSRDIQGWSDLSALRRLTQLMREFRPHIVHTHTAKAGTLGRLAARLVSVPVVIHTYHGHVLHGYFSPTKTRLFVVIERFLARYTTCLVTVSERIRQELLGFRIGTPDRLAVVPLGLDLDRFLACEELRGQLRAELGIAATTPLIGIIARLVPIKRHEWFLDAARVVRQRHPTCQFLLVGDGERRQELEEMVKRGSLANYVHFLGWRHDLDRIYGDLDLVVLTSANEGSPVSLIEAMAAGRAVISTRVGGVADIVDENVAGLLVPPGEPALLAEAIETLLTDSSRRAAMGKAGRARVYPAFSAQRLVDDIDQLYTQLLVGKL